MPPSWLGIRCLLSSITYYIVAQLLLVNILYPRILMRGSMRQKGRVRSIKPWGLDRVARNLIFQGVSVTKFFLYIYLNVLECTYTTQTTHDTKIIKCIMAWKMETWGMWHMLAGGDRFALRHKKYSLVFYSYFLLRPSGDRSVQTREVFLGLPLLFFMQQCWTDRP